jgi:transposase
LAAGGQRLLRGLAQRVAAVIRVDAVWLATEPLDMRAGADTALARVVQVFGAAHPHSAYLFANKRANRMKVLVIDGLGIWLAARRLHQGHFVWPKPGASGQLELSRAQLDALVLGLPWARIVSAQPTPS